ncbi:hypothetical protein E2R66_05080 [Mucilaginibacter psychrotolerans]|uniref:Uncharacterized protein n=1 Tax=Mucilaginibacter psychrotolerans TaxID=1524096 RepID=A0A4Y8SM88_9SPHI|nr:hypothetical protein E2R66_05080 [Mucilaginibacter psychrotolerans]
MHQQQDIYSLSLVRYNKFFQNPTRQVISMQNGKAQWRLYDGVLKQVQNEGIYNRRCWCTRAVCIIVNEQVGPKHFGYFAHEIATLSLALTKELV